MALLPSHYMVGPVGPDSSKSAPLSPTLQQLLALVDLLERAPVAGDAARAIPRRIKRRLTGEAINQIVALYVSGVGTPQLCADFGVSKPSMLTLLRERGVVMRRQPLSASQRQHAVELYEQGLAIKPIAVRLGSSYGAVHRVLLAEGVSLRPRPGR